MFSRLLGYRNHAGSSEQVIFLKPGVRAARKPAKQSSRVREAETAAQWLTGTHAAGLSAQAKSEFWRQRKAEILARTFPSQYWHELSNVRDEVQLGYPTCEPYTDPIPAEYDDPERRPSVCQYSAASTHYNTPAGLGTPSEPAPGWAGALDDGVFKDQWFAQRYIRFTSPEYITSENDRPLLCSLDLIVTANAELRGNRMWFSPTTWATLSTWTGRYIEMNYISASTLIYPYRLPPTVLSGWSHTIQIQIAFDLKRMLANPSWAGASGLHFKHAYRPAAGLFFSGNEWADAHWSGDIRIYYAKSN